MCIVAEDALDENESTQQQRTATLSIAVRQTVDEKIDRCLQGDKRLQAQTATTTTMSMIRGRMRTRHTPCYWEVYQNTLCGRVLLCSAKMKLDEHQARNVVDNNKRKGMNCDAVKAKRPRRRR
jgi:hypothetical protein